MMRRIVAVACLLTLICATAWAGSPDSKMTPEQMAAMKAEFMKCAVCKSLGAHFDELMPVMKMEAVKLNNGTAVFHKVTDPSKVAMFHASCDQMMKAGAETAKMTDEQAKAQLCSFCQDMRSVMMAGAKMSTGKTKNGDLMVLSSDDPAVQAKLADLHNKCAMMAGDVPAQAQAAK